MTIFTQKIDPSPPDWTSLKSRACDSQNLDVSPPPNPNDTSSTTLISFALAGGILLVIFLDLPNLGIADEDVVRDPAQQRHRESLRGAHDESPEGGHGADATGGTTRDRSGTEELGIAIDQPFGLTDECGRSEHVVISSARGGGRMNTSRGREA